MSPICTDRLSCWMHFPLLSQRQHQCSLWVRLQKINSCSSAQMKQDNNMKLLHDFLNLTHFICQQVISLDNIYILLLIIKEKSTPQHPTNIFIKCSSGVIDLRCDKIKCHHISRDECQCKEEN